MVFKNFMNSAILKWHPVLLVTVLAGMSISTNARAINVLSQPANTMHHWYVGTDIGLMQTHINQGAMTVPNGSNYPSSGNVDQYSLNQQQPIMLDIQAGHRWNRDNQWIPSFALALRYQHIFKNNISGMVTQYSDPEFTNYSYTWGVSADVLSLYFKLDLVLYGRLMPYVDMGLGVSFNQSHAYNETALPNVMARYSPDFASKTSNQFTYNVGAGLDYLLTTNLIMSAGYSYQSFGTLSSGYGQNPNWGNTQIKLGKIYSNMGFIGISYLF